MLDKWTPLREFCRTHKFSEGTLRNYIFNAKKTGIVASGAAIRIMGRWYIDPDKFVEWSKACTATWYERQPEPVAK